MRVISVSGGRTPRIQPARKSAPKRWKALAWYFRPRFAWIMIIASAVYVHLAGWPSVLVWQEQQSHPYVGLVTLGCHYFNPKDGLQFMPWDRCPILLEGSDANNSR